MLVASRWIPDAAADWIDANQLGRRNLTPDQMSLLRGRRYNRLKGKREDNLKQNIPKGHFVPSGRTADKLAGEHGVDARTIRRDGQYAEAVGRRYNRLKKAAHRPQKRPQNEDVKPERTAERLVKCSK